MLVMLMLAQELEPVPAPIPPPEAVAAAPAVAPTEALAAVDARAERLTVLRYTVLRRVQAGGQTAEERFRVVIDGVRFRVDYSGDTRRLVICDGSTLFEYVPALQQANRHELERMEPEARQRIVGQVLAKVAIPGLRTGFDPSMTWSWGPVLSVGTRSGPSVVGTDTAGGRLEFVLEPQLRYLLRSELRKAGDFIVSVVASDHVELVPGTWVPQRVAMRTPGEQGPMDVELRVGGLEAGRPITDLELRPEIPEDLKVEVFP